MLTYSSIIKSKTNSEIPIFSSGKSLHSKYNPENEAKTFAENLKYADFFVIESIGAGFFINEIKKRFPDSHIIAVEETDEDIDFLRSNFPLVKKLEENRSIDFSSIINLKKTLLTKFIPQLFPEFSFQEIRSWQNEKKESSEKIREIIKESLNEIKKDFSVQCHFGKFFQHNILKNLEFLSSRKIPVAVNKTCLILAAGPTLEKTIGQFLSEREKYFIISTDTAFLFLSRAGFKSDIVVSIDGQAVSHNHFMTKIPEETSFVFDLQGNPTSVRYITKKGGKICFCSNHPLSFFIEKKCGKKLFLNLSSGAGTVTLSALDLALKLGFKDIKILGADFSYPFEKPYTKGTYLDSIYSSRQNIFNNIEEKYTKLIFRTETSKENGIYHTEILDSYRKSFQDFIREKNIKADFRNGIYTLRSENMEKFPEVSSFSNELIREKLNLAVEEEKTHVFNRNELTDFETALLPFMAFLRINLEKENPDKLFNIALADFIKYNKLL